MAEPSPPNGNDPKPATKPKRERSPSFPFINLQAAIKRLVEFEEYFKRHPAPAKHSGKAWGMKGWTSQAQQTLAALKSFGLVDYQGSGDSLEAVVSEDGRTYLRSQQEIVKRDVLKRVALKPKNLAKYFARWGADRPPDEVCLDQLVLKGGFTEASAKLFLSVYDATIAYAGLTASDKVPSVEQPSDDDGEADPPPPAPEVKVGDFVQWTSGGVDRLPKPCPVEWIAPDGTHLRVVGSMTGIPMSEVTVTQPQALKPPAPALKPAAKEAIVAATNANMASAAAVAEEKTSDGNEISVYLAGNRLHITANVDDKGIEKLEQALAGIKPVLKLLQ